jgi:pullulanase
VLLSQGVPFFQAGDDLLRSKSLRPRQLQLRRLVQRLDWTYQTTNWGAACRGGRQRKQLAGDAAAAGRSRLKPAPADIQASVAHIANTLQMRKSSPLFRLQTEADIMARLKFYNTGAQQIPGLIVMSLRRWVALPSCRTRRRRWMRWTNRRARNSSCR